MKRILVSTSSFGVESKAPIDLLHDAGYEIILNPHGRKLTKAETIDLLKDVDGVIAGTETYSADVIEQVKNIKIISRCGAGIDGIDVEALKAHKIALANTPEVHMTAVAELTLTGLLAVLKKLIPNHTHTSAGKWEKIMGSNLSGKRVGLIGFGHVGKSFYKLLKGFDCEVLVYDPWIQVTDTILQTPNVSSLLEWSDVISLHVPLTEETRNIISEKSLQLVKKNVIVLNTSRGGLIDELALFNFLNSNPTAGAFLDVFEEEPYRGRLGDLSNVILTPHIGTFTRETRVQMELQSVHNVLNFFNHG